MLRASCAGFVSPRTKAFHNGTVHQKVDLARKCMGIVRTSRVTEAADMFENRLLVCLHHFQDGGTLVAIFGNRVHQRATEIIVAREPFGERIEDRDQPCFGRPFDPREAREKPRPPRRALFFQSCSDEPVF